MERSELDRYCEKRAANRADDPNYIPLRFRARALTYGTTVTHEIGRERRQKIERRRRQKIEQESK